MHLMRVPATKLQTGQRFPIVSGGKIGLKIGLNIVYCVASLRLCCVVFPTGVVAASCQKCPTFLHMHTSDCAGTHTGFDREMCQGCTGVRLAENNNRCGKCEKKIRWCHWPMQFLCSYCGIWTPVTGQSPISLALPSPSWLSPFSLWGILLWMQGLQK